MWIYFPPKKGVLSLITNWFLNYIRSRHCYLIWFFLTFFQSSKRTLRSNEIELPSNGLLDTEIELTFSLQVSSKQKNQIFYILCFLRNHLWSFRLEACKIVYFKKIELFIFFMLAFWRSNTFWVIITVHLFRFSHKKLIFVSLHKIKTFDFQFWTSLSKYYYKSLFYQLLFEFDKHLLEVRAKTP